MDSSSAVQEVIETIRDGYEPGRIVLFGSRIWGTPGDESDLDLLVIKSSAKPEIERMQEVYRLVDRYQRRPYRLPLDILVKTLAEIRHPLAIGDHFIRQIMERGRVVYERAAV